MGDVFDAAQSVEYQEGGVVSRIAMKGKAGSVTIFAFDEGQELSEHSAPFDALIYVVEGEGQMFIDGKPHTVGAGEMLIFPANVPHAVKAPSRFKMILTMIRG